MYYSILSVQDSDDYRTLQRNYELIIKQLEEERKESARLREVTEKLRSEIIIVRQDTDKSVREVRGLPFDKFPLQNFVKLHCR